MATSLVKGSIVALVTPFNADGSVNYDKLGELIDFHVENKTDGIILLGTTGESPTLTFEEEEKMLEYSVKRAAGRIYLIAGSGSNCTETAVERTRAYSKTGVDAMLVITPYYNRANTSGMIKHFTACADASEKPIIMYNVPGRTGCSISEEAVAVLCKHPNIQGIKEASGNISYLCKIAKYLDEDFVMYSGNDDMIVPTLSMGGIGVISVWANIMPQTTHKLVFDYLEGNVESARKIQTRYLDLVNDLFLETNPIPVKAAMNYLGYGVGPCRMPLDEMSAGPKAKLVAEIDRLKDELK